MTKVEVLGALLCKAMGNDGGNGLAEYFKKGGEQSEELGKAQYELWEKQGRTVFDVKKVWVAREKKT